MKLLGDANWWLPAWLDRIIPNLDIEGESKLPPDEFEPATGIEDPDSDDIGDRELQPV
jgi:RND superfamily putative drug exporter